MTGEPRSPLGRPLPELLGGLALAGIVLCLVLMQLEIRRLRTTVAGSSHPGPVVALPRWEYIIESPTDDVFKQTMARLGAEGWELVSARRSTAPGSTAYEMIFKRLVVEKSVAPATAPVVTPPSAVSTALDAAPPVPEVTTDVSTPVASLVSARFRVTEETNTFGRLAYILTISASRAGQATIDVRFKDASGFVVDTDFIPNVTLHQGLNEFSDETLMKVENVRKAVNIDATIRPQ